MIRPTLVLIFLFSFSSVSWNLRPAVAQPPNFVIFVADDMAWNDCGAYGNPAVRTPNIDRLAKQGMRFDRALLTCSSCSPSRCSMLTGRYPHNTGAGELHLPLPEDQVLLTTPLRKAGYWTAAIGKWHLGKSAESQVDQVTPSRPETMDQAWVSALKQRPMDKPFFLWAAHSDPHRGYRKGAVDPPHDPQRVVVPPFFPDTKSVRNDLALYYDEVCRFDRHIGVVLDELDRQGIAEDTFVLVISDNGRPFPHCKTRVTLPGVGTPFVVRFPKRVKAGSTSDRVISTLDVAPTILELAGLEPLASFQGQTFAPALDDPNYEVREFAFAEHNWHDYMAFERAVHSRRYCYVRNWLPDVPGTPPADAVNSPTFAEIKRLDGLGQLGDDQKGCLESPRPAEFLYDVIEDPQCLKNLAGDSALSEVLGRHREALARWQSDTEDVFPGKDKLTPDGFDRETGKRIIKRAHPSLR